MLNEVLNVLNALLNMLSAMKIRLNAMYNILNALYSTLNAVYQVNAMYSMLRALLRSMQYLFQLSYKSWFIPKVVWISFAYGLNICPRGRCTVIWNNCGCTTVHYGNVRPYMYYLTMWAHDHGK